MRKTQTTRFNSNITDEQLRAFLGAENIIEIVRESWISRLRFLETRRTKEKLADLRTE